MFSVRRTYAGRLLVYFLKQKWHSRFVLMAYAKEAAGAYAAERVCAQKEQGPW